MPPPKSSWGGVFNVLHVAGSHYSSVGLVSLPFPSRLLFGCHAWQVAAITWKRGSISCLGCMQPPRTHHVHGAVSGEIFGHKSVEMLVLSTQPMDMLCSFGCSFYRLEAYSADSSTMIGNFCFCKVLNFNQLLLKLNTFIW